MTVDNYVPVEAMASVYSNLVHADLDRCHSESHRVEIDFRGDTVAIVNVYETEDESINLGAEISPAQARQIAELLEEYANRAEQREASAKE